MKSALRTQHTEHVKFPSTHGQCVCARAPVCYMYYMLHVYMYLIVWQPCGREDRYFLSSGDAVHAVDGRYAGLDHLLGVDPTLRVYRLT